MTPDLRHGTGRVGRGDEERSLWQDARSGHPATLRGRVLLSLIALIQIIATVALAPLVAVWYGLHEMPGWFRESIRPAYKTLRYGKSGPYKGVAW